MRVFRPILLTLATTLPPACAVETETLPPEATQATPAPPTGPASPSAPRPPPTCSGFHCSPDLHTVRNCVEDVVEECGVDQGCGEAKCVSACDAAAANRSVFGCEYIATPRYENEGCEVAVVNNTWTTSAKLTLTRGKETVDAAKHARLVVGQGSDMRFVPLPGEGIPPGESAVVFLADPYEPGTFEWSAFGHCPSDATPIVVGSPLLGSGVGNAIVMRSSVPVTAHAVAPFGLAASTRAAGTLLHATSSWDASYSLASVVPTIKSTNFLGLSSASILQVVAKEDATAVTFTSPVAHAGGPGFRELVPGEPRTFLLDRGELVQIGVVGNLAGTPVEANKPVGVFEGVAVASSIDDALQQMPPLSALGSAYVALGPSPPCPAKPSPGLAWRIVGAVDGTKLTYSPARPDKAPETLARGQGDFFETPEAFVVKSQDEAHPFLLLGYMRPEECKKTAPRQPSTARGDLEIITPVPLAAFPTAAVFITDPTLDEAEVDLVRRADARGFSDVVVDCVGKVEGWQPVGVPAEGVEFARVKLVVDGRGQGRCDHGRRRVYSRGPVSVTVWGWDGQRSYAFSAAHAFAPRNFATDGTR